MIKFKQSNILEYQIYKYIKNIKFLKNIFKIIIK